MNSATRTKTAASGAPKASLAIVPVVPQRAFEDIAAQLHAHIVEGKLKPGDRLPVERDLSTMFQVSRSTVREALRALELKGLIELRKGSAGGAFVTTGSLNVIRDGLADLYHLGTVTPEHLTEARIGLSQIVVGIACERITQEELSELETNVEQAALAHAAGDFARRTQLHQHFHVLLAKATHNPILIANTEGLVAIVHQFVQAIGPVDRINVLPSRRRVVKHIQNRDAELATHEMVRSIERVQKYYMALWRAKA